MTALERALSHRVPEIHHSDQGIQPVSPPGRYAAHGYVQRLQNLGVQISMSARGQASDNPYAGRVIRTIKEEEVYLADYVDYHDAYERIGRFIEDVYQTRRIHPACAGCLAGRSALGYLTPVEFEAAYWAAQEAAPP